ncbi:hypothetical protein K9U39_10970 [Rhodoblastus acidophilus]|uniref:Uncharacterized protein n=1 Tax=Candidatus Rhodoblastus alkanivorans TaxID=2954117 RepID=A0ABS9Z8X1_9HYPH|nr:hypothetical protein [Candidatus Rhodoblastus alkanivorans]MCI4680176.1 hypothetical protein [Candidatus Rhodoblastus alkanivorans]MCI4684133.1 hypothetical protein [Candidatus Rhodoblastus alkanivorans]MDI4641453.1 hypothetical protein [Rhodoblastus acidophilus]
MSNTTSVAFGSGVLIATPSGPNATPVQFGSLQDISIDISFSSKQLFGQYQFPIALARGEGKISGKAKFANIDGPLFNNCFFGQSLNPGQKLWAYNEAGAVPSSASYTYSAANAVNFDEDLGVVYAASGLALVKVASAPAVGQYSVAGGVYTFNSGDAGKAVLVSYSYTQTSGGSRAVISNKVMGTAPTFQIDFYQTNPNVAGAQWSLRLYNCVSSKLSIASKMQDFAIPELDFEALANSANAIGEINTAV